MLSFMSEQGFDDSGVQETAKSSNGEAKKSQDLKSPKPSDKAKEQQYLTVTAQGKDVRKMTMLLAVLFVIGLLCLWIMIKKSAPRTATAASAGTEETQIEKAIARLTGAGSEMFKRMDQIVKKFYEFSDVRQVRVNELVKNPFERQIFLADAPENSDSRGAELLRQQRLKQRKKELQLLTICQTDQVYSCMINDKILYEGDTIKGFKVSQISDAFVKLELEGMEIVLKLSQ
jgi:preprotein translocase subunit SecG